MGHNARYRSKTPGINVCRAKTNALMINNTNITSGILLELELYIFLIISRCSSFSVPVYKAKIGESSVNSVSFEYTLSIVRFWNLTASAPASAEISTSFFAISRSPLWFIPISEMIIGGSSSPIHLFKILSFYSHRKIHKIFSCLWVYIS